MILENEDVYFEKIKITKGFYSSLLFEHKNKELGELAIVIDRLIFFNINEQVILARKHNTYYVNLDDVIKYCITYLGYDERFKTLQKKHKRKLIQSFIKKQKTYLIKDNNTGYYKIGKSVNPKVRERTLQSKKPTYTTVKVWDKNIESELHRKYKKYRKRGEWFELNKIQVKYICTHY